MKALPPVPPKSKQNPSRFGLEAAVTPQPLTMQHITAAVASTGPLYQNSVP